MAKEYFVVHEGTGTVISLEECTVALIENDEILTAVFDLDQEAEYILENATEKIRGWTIINYLEGWFFR